MLTAILGLQLWSGRVFPLSCRLYLFISNGLSLLPVFIFDQMLWIEDCKQLASGYTVQGKKYFEG